MSSWPGQVLVELKREMQLRYPNINITTQIDYQSGRINLVFSKTVRGEKFASSVCVTEDCLQTASPRVIRAIMEAGIRRILDAELGVRILEDNPSSRIFGGEKTC